MEAASGGTPATKAVLFDLDGTLFDHYHSVRSAISAIQAKYSSLTGYETEHLITKYNEALQEAYDRYLAKEISYDECDTLKVRLFFTTLGLPEPSPDEVKVYRDTYKPAYRENRRATPGSIEMLVRLREHGYRLAIVSNGQAEDQVAKAQSIGVHHLVDRILTSEEAGCCKPDRQIFQLAISTLGADPSTAVMVGDSVVTDVKGVLDVGIRAVLYSPVTYERVRIVSSNTVPVIRHMSQLGEHLGIGNPR
jgi:HAD superfamily hydrolase (TIGR01549 family)